MSNEYEKKNAGDLLNYLYWRDEILQLIYWMTGEGLGREFNDSEPRPTCGRARSDSTTWRAA
jgi:hypothetical protein